MGVTISPERGAATVVPELGGERGIVEAMRVLFIVTSADRLAPDHPTGVWLDEYAIPFVALEEAGIEIVVCSPKGGQGPIDPKTAPDSKTDRRWDEALQALAQTRRLDEIDAEPFDAVFIPGGHGPLVDLANDPRAAALIGDFTRQGKIIAAVCHGPAALLSVVASDGQALLRDRKATGFTNGEETAVKLDKVVPFLLEDRMRAAGAKFEHALVPGACHIVRDGDLLTGQNPASSEAVAKMLLTMLGERQREDMGVAPDA